MALQLWETLKEAIQAYTGLSPPTFFTLLALGLAVYYVVSGLFGSSDDHRVRAKKSLLMGIKGQIYDVSQSSLHARKRKELIEQKKLKIIETEEEHVDERSVDDPLSFINGGDVKGVRASKHKKKNRARKDQIKDVPSNKVNGTHCKELDDLSTSYSGSDTFTSKLDFDDADVDDDLDPAMEEELDREVEDFARRLNSDWTERIQEILSLGSERRNSPVSFASNPSSQPCIGLDRR